MDAALTYQLALKSVIYFFMDSFDLVLGRRNESTPPRRIRSDVGDGDFKAIGNEYLKIFIDICNLKPNEKVLDVGCGIGRIAVPLTRFLNKDGRYDGFDIVRSSIDWCRTNISPKYPNFRFRFADIFNKRYNPNGRLHAEKYKFPYEDESFDLVFLTSVFTHMLPQSVENYLSEISRVLRKDGRCLITYFLMNAESSKLIQENQSSINLKYSFGKYCTTDENISESLVCFNEQFIRKLYERCQLVIKEPVLYGSWCRRRNFLRYQDIIIASTI